ncbi:unnamed protein product [Aphanomyces euteiches]|uniref:Uncharacterized protein n=1 Tax=Aphanomyces euteiches TaxID=100861 RepID=A0A6G0XCA6_9STRA|nr:hypothetical protein Ae201684_006257 [Aphanomyces euteiches]KAH9068570.1 hypothetical protein Ae201684P_004273 [Aphanomyces euteiches]KAH9144142.1 hypothetical protein AeRB84_011891 [Aphanomyces euteiches]
MTELQTCRYSHGKCKLPRATKKNGTMHTLCEYHRTKACAHQKKLDAKRRTEKLRLLESKKAMQHHAKAMPPIHGDLHLWKEEENRMPQLNADLKYKPVWESHDAMYNQSYTHGGLRNDFYDQVPHSTSLYDDRYSKFPSVGRSSSPTLPSTNLRKDDAPFRLQYAREPSYPAPSYPSPTSYSTSPYVDSNVSVHYDHKPLTPRQSHVVPHHMTTGPEFDGRYHEYYEEPASYGRSFGQYPPQPVFHQ